MEERKVNLGKEILSIRSLLKLRREEFAKITSMSVDEIKALEENETSITMLQRFKICIALETLLKYHREKYHSIVVGQIERAIAELEQKKQILEAELSQSYTLETYKQFEALNYHSEYMRDYIPPNQSTYVDMIDIAKNATLKT